MRPASNSPLLDDARALRHLQQRMASLILHPDDLAPDEARDLFTLPAGVIATERLHVYADGYPARIAESLAETFPAVTHVIGRGALFGLVQRYVRAHPPASYNLNHCGRALSAFLREDALSQELPFLPDLAELEWRVAEAFHAVTAAPVDPADLSAWSLDQWEHATLRFQTGTALVESAWPIRDIWAARDTPIEAVDIDLQDRPDRVLVFRSGVEVHCRSVSEAEAAALAPLLAGRSLGEVTRTLAADGHDASEVSTWFAQWMGAGLITACSAGRQPV